MLSLGSAWENAARFAMAAVLVVGAGVTLWLNLPGHLSYDSVVQLAEGRAGVYGGQHPPVMSWMLGVADRITPGAALFVIFDTLLIYGALLALVLLPPRASWLAAPLAVLCVCLPQLALYPAIVWKDVLFAGSAAAGFACLAWAAGSWPRVRVRAACLAATTLLLALAALARQNGAVVLPFASLGLGLIAARSGEKLGHALAYAAGFLAVVLPLFAIGSAALATRLETPGVAEQAWTALQTYDITAAVARDPRLELQTLRARAPALETLIRTQGVRSYSPIRVDSIEPIFDHFDDSAAAPIAAQWRALILRHPLLYLRVRGTAFGWVFLTPQQSECVLDVTGVDGPAEEMAGAGLKPRRTAMDDALDGYAKAFAPTPAYSHATYGLVGLALLAFLLRRRRAPDFAVAAMLGGAFAFAASFAVISIACDYRYLYDLDLAVIAAALYAAASAGRTRARGIAPGGGCGAA
ncbi:MAG TPA: hypothetical protein VN814_01840 [Caulobacteraceae bacterium]|nr:hypothetical protein [Caulobacteraceae bacterium]